MDQQRLARGQIGQNVLGSPSQRQNPLAGQPIRHSFGQGPAQIGAVHFGQFDRAAFHRGQKPTADGFNFGQFGHRIPMDSSAHCSFAPPLYKVAQNQGRQDPMTYENTTHFGFQTVPEAEKAAMMDGRPPGPDRKLRDGAGGTGDVSFRFLKRAPGAHATVLYMTESMLVSGRQRAEADSMADRLNWVVGDAMALPFADNTFDVYTISFGIRNVTRVADALREAYRVLSPGGRLMVLEFSRIPNDLAQWAYDKYSFNVIPVMGQIVAGDRDSYQYLVESIRKFPDQETFASMIRTAGFDQVKYRNLTMGVAALHSGWKL